MVALFGVWGSEPTRNHLEAVQLQILPQAVPPGLRRTRKVPPTNGATRLVVWEMLDVLLVEEELEVALMLKHRPYQAIIGLQAMVEAPFVER